MKYRDRLDRVINMSRIWSEKDIFLKAFEHNTKIDIVPKKAFPGYYELSQNINIRDTEGMQYAFSGIDRRKYTVYHYENGYADFYVLYRKRI